MTIHTLTKHQAQMIADCIEIGLEGAADMVKDGEDHTSQADLEAVQRLAHVLKAFAERDDVAGVELGIQMIDEHGAYVQRHAHQEIIDAWFAAEYGEPVDRFGQPTA